MGDMKEQNIVLYENQNMDKDTFDFDELEEILENVLDVKKSELEFLKSELDKIGNPDALGDTIKNIIWEQFDNQIAATLGEDFIKKNRGLTLDLRDDAHIQTGENFEKGIIASHNTHIDYQKRYDDWQDNFQKNPDNEKYKHNNNYRYSDEQKVWEKHDNRSGSWKKVLNKEAREDFDKGRPNGQSSNNTDMDHTISAAEIIRDPAANAHLTREEQVVFANSEKNLNLMDSAANQSKGDSTMSEWLDSERDGKKPAERFNINEEELRQKDKAAREGYKNVIDEGNKISKETGKQSQKEEALRAGGTALKAVVITLLSKLLKKIIAKLVMWFKDKKRNFNTLKKNLKTAIKSFTNELATHLKDAGLQVAKTIAATIIGPIFRTLTRIWTMLKQAGKVLKDAVTFLLNPSNKEMPIEIKLFEVSKICIAGITGAGAIVIGEVIEKGLMTIPGLAIEIPFLGNLASIIGIFMGAAVSGIIGAVVINLIDRWTAKKRKAMVTKQQIDKGNEILKTQVMLLDVKEEKMYSKKEETASDITSRHDHAAEFIKNAMDEIFTDKSTDHSADFDNMNAALELLNEK